MQMQVKFSKRPVYKELTTLSKFRTPPLFFIYLCMLLPAVSLINA